MAPAKGVVVISSLTSPRIWDRWLRSPLASLLGFRFDPEAGGVVERVRNRGHRDPGGFRHLAYSNFRRHRLSFAKRFV
jgi:hypothetical protein